MRARPLCRGFGDSRGICSTFINKGEDLRERIVWSVQADVADAAHTGYENIPRDANHRDDLGWHGCSMTEGEKSTLNERWLPRGEEKTVDSRRDIYMRGPIYCCLQSLRRISNPASPTFCKASQESTINPFSLVHHRLPMYTQISSTWSSEPSLQTRSQNEPIAI